MEVYLALVRQTEEYFEEIMIFEKKKAEMGLFMPDQAVETVIAKWKNYPSDFRWKIWMVLSGRQWRLVVYRGNAKPTIHVSDRK